MAELFVGQNMDKIINTCFEYLQDHLGWQTNLKELEKRLRENQPKIQAVVSAASQTSVIDQDTPLNKWIWKLRDAIDEADDLLDEFAYMEHKEGLARNKETTKVRSTLKFISGSPSKIGKVCAGFFKTDLKTDSNVKRLEEVVQKLDKISAEVSTFLYLLKDAKHEQQVHHLELLKAREEGSLPSGHLIGRGQEMEYIIQWLRKPVETDITTNNLYNNISVLTIVGDGGMGKTSLLQHVYQDEKTKEFDLKIWVCVSNNFDIKKVFADMLESSKENRPSLEDINILQERLKSKVMSKKFLLVLDDIWEKDEERDKNKWKKVFAPLAYGSSGSKILITTRMDSVASMISKVTEKKMEKLTLNGLEEDECLLLLNTHAFANVKNQNDHKKIEIIAGDLVKRLFGSPLAAKVMGGVLSSNLAERYWKNVLRRDLGHNDIFSILNLSYLFLPKNLQNCFTFCSIFPQDYKFYKDDLVRMWIAVGFIQTYSIQGEDLEDVGERYFDLLVKKSFFDKVWTGCYKMHDLLHDMARSISAQECFRFVGDDQKLFTGVPETIRHLSIKTNNVEVLRNLGKFKNIRTLWITYDDNNQYFDDALSEIFKETRSIRLLYIRNYHQEEPTLKNIGCLMHLRYLHLEFRALGLIPIISLCNLYHLQFIRHNSNICLPDRILPRDMSNLSNLRSTNFLLKFPGIGKLKLLQDPLYFYVKNEIGYRIGELEHMNYLPRLDINCLENVRDAKEACNAKLCDKRKLTELSLNWGKYSFSWKAQMRKNIIDPNLEERVLDNLQPHHHLKTLRILFYMGVRSAKWMNEADSIKNLEEIELNKCLEWENLPPFGQLLFLKSLSLRYMPKAKRFDDKYHGNDSCYVFQSLEKLTIDGLKALEDWFNGGVKAEDGCLFPCLTKLTLKDCPNLQELPYSPPMLKILEITNVGWKTLNCCSISKSISLERLVVRCCPNITYIFLAGEIGRVAIEDCPNLTYFGGHEEVETSVESLQCLPSSLSSISSLKKLSLRSIPLLKSLTYLPPSLCELFLLELDNLDCLPSCLPNLSTLTLLHIIKVPKLRKLPDLPPSLRSLFLDSLDNLDCLPSCIHNLSSPTLVHISKIPKLLELPDLPPSLCELHLKKLDNLDLLPSCLPTLSSLIDLRINEAPKLRELPDLPPSLRQLFLEKLDNLDRLPSCLSTLSSLTLLHIIKVPKLRELPDLPPSLRQLFLEKLDNLDHLPSRLPSLSSLIYLRIIEVPKLQELPDLPPSLRIKEIYP